MTSRILTRWLWQGVRFGICPLCRAHHKLDREYIWGFFDQWSMQDTAVARFAAARGFCSDHAEQLCRIEVQGMHTTIGVTDVYIATVQRLVDDLVRLESDAAHGLSKDPCPACSYRQEGVSRNARYLLEELLENSDFREQLTAGQGLCVAHFNLAWATADVDEQREILRAVQSTVASRLLVELNEHARKQRAEAAGEPAGAEADSWQRAIWMTAGRPAPVRAASVPEANNPYSPAGEPAASDGPA